MDRSFSPLNKMSVLALGVIAVSISASTYLAVAAAPVLQPKIATVKQFIVSKNKTTAVTNAAWPDTSGEIVQLESTAASVKIGGFPQKEFKKKLYWAFVPVWTEEAPDRRAFLATSKNLAAKRLKANSFGTKSESAVVAINLKEHSNMYLTIYAFATNKDKVTGAPNFPFLIDYAAARTFLVSDYALYQDLEPPTSPSEAVPLPKASVNDDWSQLSEPKAGYKD